MAVLSRYVGTWNPGAVKKTVVAEDMETAARIFKEDELTDPSLLQCVETEVHVEIPMPLVPCVTEVLPVEAEAAGALATPSEYTFLAGTSPVFEAIGAEGWAFDHWEIDEVSMGTDPIQEITIPSAVTVPLVVVAVFVPNP